MSMTESQNLGQKLQSLPKQLLYLILIIVCTLPLFKPIKLPNKPVDPTIDLFTALNEIPEGKTILISSDWTNSTRGESGGQFDALLRIVESRHLKFALFSIADPQAPEVAMNELRVLNDERVANGQKPYERWNDWINLGYFPNGEGTTNALAASLTKAFAGKTDLDTNSQSTDVFQSPVLKGLTTLKDIPIVINVTASATTTVFVQRLSGKVPLGFMVTGVMGPETQVYYTSGQLTGLSSGMKGVYDLETMMATGVNHQNPGGDEVTSSKFTGDIPPLSGKFAVGKGQLYFPALHFALGLLIIAVVIGNVGMYLSNRKSA